MNINLDPKGQHHQLVDPKQGLVALVQLVVVVAVVPIVELVVPELVELVVDPKQGRQVDLVEQLHFDYPKLVVVVQV
jgi:hypothetical protein